MQSKLQKLAAKIEAEQLEMLIVRKVDCEPNRKGRIVTIEPGRKYTKIDLGTDHNRSGRYMVDNETGAIHAIKGYGKVHKTKTFGTLDTIDEWYFGDYQAMHTTDSFYLMHLERLAAANYF